MALIGTLRNKMGKIVVGAITLTMFAFIGTDLIGNSTLLGGGQEPNIAEIGGKSITNRQFQNKVDELSYYFALNADRAPLQKEIDQIRVQAWNALIINNAYEPQLEQLGIGITDAELVDMVQGNNISPQIQQFFADPNTGQFSKESVTGFLAKINEASPKQQNTWLVFEQSLIPSRKIEKYSRLFELTNYVTKHEAKEQYVNQTADISVEYVYVPFLSVPDTTVDIIEGDLKKYLNDHEKEFRREESRRLKFVAFDLIPSSYDSAALVKEVNELVAELQKTTNDSTYIHINSDDPLPFITYTDDNLPDSLVGKEVGFITRPQLVNDAYECYKLSRVTQIAEDSASYKVAKMKKAFFVSDETVNEIYRKADLFAASVGNVEEFERLAKEQGLRVLPSGNIDKNATEIGPLSDARGLVLWLYNEAKVGAVSGVKEVGDKYVVAAMTAKQDAGVAVLEDVRNQIETKVRNEKKAQAILAKLNEIEADDPEGLATTYGQEARTGTADFNLNTNTVSGIGYAPEVVGISYILDEEETTRAFQVQDGVVILKLRSKDLPEDMEDYSSYVATVQNRRLGGRTILAEFPLTYFRIIIPRSLDESVKEYADIEDLRYKFF